MCDGYNVHKPRAFELFCKSIPATPDEVSSMLADLHRHFAGWRNVALYSGINLSALQSWSKGYRTPSDASTRAIWLLWALVIRPGAIRDTHDIATWGRFTSRANPATAGTTLQPHNPSTSQSPDAENTGDD